MLRKNYFYFIQQKFLAMENEIKDVDDSALISSNLSFYIKPPLHTVQLLEYVEMAEERLKLYLFLQKHPKCLISELKSNLESSLTKLLDPADTNSLEELRRIRRIDHATHWLLRIAYCKISHSYFVKNEVLWFKLRYKAMSDNERDEFITQNIPPLTEATDEEKIKVGLGEEVYYKIPWHQAMLVVKTRQCFLNQGIAYIPKHKLLYILLQKFEKQMYKMLQYAKVVYPNSHHQLSYILSLLELPKEKTFSSNSLKISELDEAQKHFPLCMKLQYQTLMEHHHLKHYSRLQLGLFLKGIGLSLEDALEFWKTQLCKKISEANFEKIYSYFFKHIYGTVGCKTDYAPFGCKKIIDGVSNSVHGCPYKQLNSDNLRLKLQEEYLNKEDINTIVDLAKNGKYCEACTFCFNSKRDSDDCQEIISHPNNYYEKSLKTNTDIEDIF